MGDLVDITTVPNQEHIYYKITSGSLRFQVKGPSNAGIGLATSPRGKNKIWIVLGQLGFTTISKNGKVVEEVATPNILTANEFNEFWIQWHDDIISLGRHYAPDPFIVHLHNTSNLKYITFGVNGNNGWALQWMFESPPLREPMRMKPVSNGTPQWLDVDAQLPDGALIGGFEREILYIIRAKHEGSLTPGKFVPSHGVGYIPWGGTMHDKSELEVLCGYDCIWVPCSDGKVPAGAVEAGYSEDANHETLYVGRAICEEHLIPGKVQPSHKVCYIPYNEREIAMKHYEILIVPHENVQCANPYFVYDHGKTLPIDFKSLIRGFVKRNKKTTIF